MDFNIASHQAGGYSVSTSVYSGPLDLLLQLIEHAELDITAVSLAMVTDQYLTHIRTMENARPDEISAFLVIAAKLIQIKSEALLPRPPIREITEEDPAENLARQLLIYKRFKEIANFLEDRAEMGLRTYLSLAPAPKVEGRVDLSEITLADLWEAAQNLLSPDGDKQSLGSVITTPKITIREKIEYITGELGKSKTSSFKALIGTTSSRLEIVVTFLALLELIKRYRVSASQDQIFGDIALERAGDWDSAEEYELEFE